jgi:hypothetical protein
MTFISTINRRYKIFPLITILFFFSCQKSGTNDNIITPLPPDLSSKVNTSVSGFVTDDNNAAVQGATVKVGIITSTTDQYGFFEMKNVDVVKTAAVITVTKTGSFNGIKTFIAENNKPIFCRIKLMTKTNAGSINATAGGNVTLTNGLVISLPANAVVKASDNSAYLGSINVAARWINPVSTDLNLTMPGDLRGLSTDGSLKTLTTYGMTAVELTSTSGELLQIAAGKKATMTMPIPATILTSAAATIPLWYFDEVKGLWIEQGLATKSGSTYIGDVSHFSFWNCDRAVPYVIFNATVTNAGGLPVSNALVKVFLASQPNDVHFGYTNAQGYISGGLPVNSQMVIQVVGEWGCNTALFSQNFSTGTTDISLGNLVLPASATAEISGKIVDCNSTGISNGSLVMLRSGINLRYPVSNTGTFSFATSVCAAGSNITLIGQDLTANVQSTATNFTINSGANNVGNLSACTVSTSQYVNYSVNGISHAFTMPPDNIGLNGGNGYEIFAYRIPTSSEYTRFTFSKVGIAANTNMPLLTFNSNEISNNATVTANSVMVNITEYGAINGYITGSFSGTINNVSTPGSPYTITCNFRVLRWF